METLIDKNPELRQMTAVHIMRAMQGVGIKREIIEKAVTKAAEVQKKNKRISKSIETVLRF